MGDVVYARYVRIRRRTFIERGRCQHCGGEREAWRAKLGRRHCQKCADGYARRSAAWRKKVNEMVCKVCGVKVNESNIGLTTEEGHYCVEHVPVPPENVAETEDW